MLFGSGLCLLRRVNHQYFFFGTHFSFSLSLLTQQAARAQTQVAEARAKHEAELAALKTKMTLEKVCSTYSLFFLSSDTDAGRPHSRGSTTHTWRLFAARQIWKRYPPRPCSLSLPLPIPFFSCSLYLCISIFSYLYISTYSSYSSSLAPCPVPSVARPCTPHRSQKQLQADHDVAVFEMTTRFKKEIVS